MQRPQNRAELPAYPRVLVLMMLIQYGAGGALYPFLTPFLSAKGFTVEHISWIVLASACVATVTPFVWGMIADRFVPVNRLIVGMHVVAAGTLAAWSQCESFLLILTLFAVYTGFAQSTNSLVNALSYHKMVDAARQFGGLRLWGSVGWMLPSVPIGLWLYAHDSETFDQAVGCAVVLHLSIALFAPLWPHTPPLGRGKGATRFAQDLRALIRQPGFLALLVVTFFTMASFPAMFFFSSLAFDRAGVPKHWLGPVMSIGVVFEVPLFLCLRWCLASWGFRVVIGVGIGATCVRLLVFALSDDLVLLIFASLLIAPSIVFFLIGCSLAVNRIASGEVRATAQSLFLLAGSGLGSMFGLLGCALLVGFTGEVDDLSKPFLLGAGLATAGLVSLPFASFGPSGGETDRDGSGGCSTESATKDDGA